MAETTTAERFIYGKLDGDATITAAVSHRIYTDEALAGKTYPFITIHAQDPGQDVAYVNGVKVMTNSLYLVKVIGQGASYASLEAIADRIYALLHRTSGTGVYSCTRERPFSMPETSNGKPFRHLGGIYRLLLV